MSDLALFAETTYRSQNRKFGIKTDDRRRHMYLIGKTGMGKSTILENMIIEDIRAGRGVAVVDPHGDLAEKVIQYIPEERVKDVIYFNPADTDFPIAFNIVEQVEPKFRHLVASGLIGVFQKLWADSWGPRLEYILRNSILAVLDYPNSTLLSVTRMLSDKSFRKKVIENIQDPVVKSFWVKEFASYADKFASEAVSPIQNKVGQFLSSSLIRNIVGQAQSSIDLRQIMDEGKIIIMNLSKGRIGEDNTKLLGSMVITKIQLAAMSRVDMPESERKDFYLYVDEFQNFATDSFANILSEARKYRLNLIMGHQYIEQLSEMVKSAVFGNVGTLVVFRVGATDAEELVKEFTPVFTEEDLVNLPKYNTCLKLMIDGVASDPFSARGLPPLTEGERTHNEDRVIEETRKTYSSGREEVEDRIMRWHTDDEPAKPQVIQLQRDAATPGAPVNQFAAQPVQAFDNQAPRQSNSAAAPYQPATAQGILDPSIYKYEAICSRCQKMTRVPFKPDGVRPVFCKDCLALMRLEKEQSTTDRQQTKQRELEQFAGRLPSAAPAQPAMPAYQPSVAPVAAYPQNAAAPMQPQYTQSAQLYQAPQQPPYQPQVPQQSYQAPAPVQAQPAMQSQPVAQVPYQQPQPPYQPPVQTYRPPVPPAYQNAAPVNQNTQLSQPVPQHRPLHQPQSQPKRPVPAQERQFHAVPPYENRKPAQAPVASQSAPQRTMPQPIFKPAPLPPPPANEPRVSLSELGARPPLDFKGRPITHPLQPEAPRPAAPVAQAWPAQPTEPETPSHDPSLPQRGQLREGQPIQFN